MRRELSQSEKSTNQKGKAEKRPTLHACMQANVLPCSGLFHVAWREGRRLGTRGPCNEGCSRRMAKKKQKKTFHNAFVLFEMRRVGASAG